VLAGVFVVLAGVAEVAAGVGTDPDDGVDAAYPTTAMSVPAPATRPRSHHASPGFGRRRFMV
jgi:hypothetical protein